MMDTARRFRDARNVTAAYGVDRRNLTLRDRLLGQHPRGERVDVTHACPDCPTPLTALWVPPSAACTTCGGTGQVTTEQLARWQARALETV